MVREEKSLFFVIIFEPSPTFFKASQRQTQRSQQFYLRVAVLDLSQYPLKDL